MGWDHPRSRGVYRNNQADTQTDAGSSPLARGLRTPRYSAAEPGWIIPARAGFTVIMSPSVGLPLDHPRSRGVYRAASMEQNAQVGSSPLARGLLQVVGLRLTDCGIIPARAGFTRVRRWRWQCVGDHPRSRGVYLSALRQMICVTGSSPLARGLPIIARLDSAVYRIIPARAGFTRSPCGTWVRRWDHPRSRGVYMSTLKTSTSPTGSSPLARGLPPTRRY